MQQPKRESDPASRSSATTKANTRPNPDMPAPKPGPTYRAKPASPPVKIPATRDPMTERAINRFQTDTRRRRLRTAMFVVLGLLAAGTIAAYALVSPTVVKVQEVVTKVFQTPVPVRPSEDGPNATPVPVVFPNWDKKEPVNILLLGLDYRPQEKDSRADTMIIVHIDPAAKTAAMVSIPRDLWLSIPGHGEDRINASFQIGEDEAATTPGGGPGLAMATVEHNFGIKIHYFAQVDFTGFERVVDALGGVTIDVPRPLVDNDYPLPNYGSTRIYIPAGLQRMDGRTALQYARSRHADSDLGRNSRQQQVLLAIRQQGLNLNLLSKMNDLLTQLSGAVKTDLSLTQVGSLAQLAREIGSDKIQTVQVGAECVNQTVLPSGADVLLPDWACIRPKIAQAFADPQLAKEAARIIVQNGTTTGGIARKLGDEITAQGFNVVDLQSAEKQGTYPVTTIIDYSGGTKPRTLAALIKTLGISQSDVKTPAEPTPPVSSADTKPVDFVIIAGDDRLTTVAPTTTP